MSVIPQPATVGVPVPSPEVAAPPEGTVPPAAAAPKPEENVARQFAALSKKEKAIFREKEALKAERAAFEAERTQARELQEKYGKRPASPKEALERYGYSYKDATDFTLNDEQPTAEQIARDAVRSVEEMRAEQTRRDQQAAEDAQKAAAQQAEDTVTEFKGEIHDFLTEKADDYELINFHEAQDVVYHTVREHYERTGKLLSIPEAANLVERHLEDRMQKLQSTKKFAKTRQSEPPTPESGFSRQADQQAPRRTLDNTVTSSTPTLMKSPQLEDDRMKRALAALG